MEETATPVVDAVNLGGTSGDLSIWSLIMQADLVVQLVLLLLLLASVWSWAIIFDKVRRIKRLNRKADRFEDAFWSGQPLDDLYKTLRGRADHPMSRVFISAMQELEETGDSPAKDASGFALRLQDRLSQVMRVTLMREMDEQERYLGFLATVGSTAPFVGLFGTVWGIMNSFQAIAQFSDTSLAVVAPGIAEALFATAIGLLAAIPAVVAYNKFSGDLARYAGRVEGYIDEFVAIISRRLDEEGN